MGWLNNLFNICSISNFFVVSLFKTKSPSNSQVYNVLLLTIVIFMYNRSLEFSPPVLKFCIKSPQHLYPTLHLVSEPAFSPSMRLAFLPYTNKRNHVVFVIL
jgi:hypothetical protein